jgi:hypothetical protein
MKSPDNLIMDMVRGYTLGDKWLIVPRLGGPPRRFLFKPDIRPHGEPWSVRMRDPLRQPSTRQPPANFRPSLEAMLPRRMTRKILPLKSLIFPEPRAVFVPLLSGYSPAYDHKRQSFRPPHVP